MDTLCQEPDITEFSDRVITFCACMVKATQPLDFLLTKILSSYLSQLSIVARCDNDNRDRPVPVHYSTVCKRELRCQDRRVAQCVPNIFYKLEKLQIKQIQGSASLSFRRM